MNGFQPFALNWQLNSSTIVADRMTRGSHPYPLFQKCCILVVSATVMSAVDVSAQGENPITRMARAFSPELVMLEDRLSWIEERIRTMAAYNEHSLRAGIGARGHRRTSDSPDPFVMIDLGAIHVIDRIFFVPAQRESLMDDGIFPRMFTIDLSEDAEFSNPEVIFATDRVEFMNPQGRPIPFAAFNTPARFLRLTVHRGHNNKGWIDQFGLSEIIAISGNEVVSFGAHVKISDSLDSGKNWFPQALTDGRMPHGIWHSGLPSESLGDGILVERDSDIVHWELDLGEPELIDRLVVFPYKLTTSMESSVIPNRLTIEIKNHDDADWAVVKSWENRPASATCVTPQVLAFPRIEAKRIRVTGEDPWQLGDLRILGLSEIEVWSGGENIARDLPVTRILGDTVEELESLTDGFSSEFMISNVGLWLDQLHERLRFENELEYLRPRIRSVQTDSELNVTLVSVIVLSFTFMIPVFIFEKRRMIAKRRLEVLRKRIAADLHDDIGGNLGSISLIARSARRGLLKLAVPSELTHDLEEVETIARESSLAMRDIVWLIEQRNDSVGDLVQRMQEVGTRMLREVEYTLVCQSKRTDSRLSLDFKRHFFLFFKETLHNILKHSQARRVTILLDDDGDDLVLEIQDDGIGMPQEVANHPDTSRKLRQRAEVLGGDFSIISNEGQGTCIRLVIRSKKLNTTTTTTTP